MRCVLENTGLWAGNYIANSTVHTQLAHLPKPFPFFLSLSLSLPRHVAKCVIEIVRTASCTPLGVKRARGKGPDPSVSIGGSAGAA